MENVYLFFVLALAFLAIADLIVGVSNDAVNFLSSAIGSKAVSFKKIMIIASLGIALGAIFSSGMMEVARKGIFNPELYYFDEIMIIFLAVMITDILLLDFFNTLGLPTSTTVSIVFELLGAAVAIGAYKIWENNQSIVELINYINTSKATQIILGIVLSVFIAFTIGAIVQWISRLILTFDFDKNSKMISSIFGGIAITSITYFILIKGLKGTSYSQTTFDYFNGETINSIIDKNTTQIIIYLTIIWSLVSFIYSEIFKSNIYKLIILIGTFALALAFAGNDLVNFIGVPIAALESFQLWSASSLTASEYSMISLSEKVNTKPIYLFLSGLIMVITLWFSSKAKNVVKTSLDLSNQNDTDEKFKANPVGKSLVMLGVFLNELLKKLLPKGLLNQINQSFTLKDNYTEAKSVDGIRPSFDKLRACLNLVIAAILISIATSYQLPLSTTYVTFMVAMGTSLSDRAWSSDSAIYRVSGVVSVIGGWFLTAFSAFLICGLVVFTIHQLKITGILMTIIFVSIIIFKNHRKFKKKGEINI